MLFNEIMLRSKFFEFFLSSQIILVIFLILFQPLSKKHHQLRLKKQVATPLSYSSLNTNSAYR